MKKRFRLDGSVRKGLSYGVVSGVVTTLGLMIGLIGSGASKNTAIAGVLTIAFADALSDSLGMHVSEESNKKSSARQIWRTTFATAFGKMFLGISLALPIIIFPLNVGVIVDVIYGAVALILISYFIAKKNGEKIQNVLFEHLLIGFVVIAGSLMIGKLIQFLIVK